MNTVFISMSIALIAAVGLVVGLGVLSLLSGAMEFFFGRPKVTILKSQNGPNGFAFGFHWNDEKEPAAFDRVRVRLFNPFGSPSQAEVAQDFSAKKESFSQDVDFGNPFQLLLRAKGLDEATVQVEVSSTKGGVTHQFDMKGSAFRDKIEQAQHTAEDFGKKHSNEKAKPLFTIPKKTFISPPLPKTGKALKIATNPEFAGDFASSGGATDAAQENFAVSKVWIEPGCIVCDACEAIYPEVFEVLEDTCVVRDGYPTNDGLKVQEAAEACPVEVIKFSKA